MTTAVRLETVSGVVQCGGDRPNIGISETDNTVLWNTIAIASAEKNLAEK
jgi:hypothetical protein